MDIQNHFYGHAAVMAKYAGLGAPRHIPGLLQHGWTNIPPMQANFQDFPHVERRRGRSLFVWSHVSRAWHPREVARPSTPLGAPYVYLDAMAPLQESPAHGTLIIPLHGTTLARVRGDHERLADHYAEVEGPGTVCLHIEDIGRPEIVGAWQRHGNLVVSAGHRHDKDFLGRILGLMRSHVRVVSNRMSTAVVYAGASGRVVSIHGDPMSLGPTETMSAAQSRAVWPEFHGVDTIVSDTTDVARREVGWEYRRSPEELKELFGWNRRQAGPLLDYWLAAPIQKTGHVFGIGERAVGSPDAAEGLSLRHYLQNPLTHLPHGLGRALPQTEPLPSALVVPSDQVRETPTAHDHERQ